MKTRGLLRYRPSGVFFFRTRYKGKLLLGSLETTDNKTASDRLPVYKKQAKRNYDDKKSQNKQTEAQPTTWREAAEILDTKLLSRAKIGDIKFITLAERRLVIRKISAHWPSIDEQAVREIDPMKALEFFADARSGEGLFTPRSRNGHAQMKGNFRGGKQGSSSYNKMLQTAAEIVAIASKCDQKKQLPSFDNPFEEVPRLSVRFNKLVMPTDDEWAQILDAIESFGAAGDGQHCKTQRLCAEFESITGARMCEVIGKTFHTHKQDEPHPGFRWYDIKKGYNVLTCAKKLGDQKLKPRDVPWIDGAEELMKKIHDALYKGDDNALVFGEMSPYGLRFCLRRAIKKCGLQKKLKGFTEHKIRHLFGTKCAEAGCSWKAIADMLGHEDGGILAAKLYSHARKESVAQQAAQVSYRKKKTKPIKRPSDSTVARGNLSPTKNITIDGQAFTYREVCKMAAKYHAEHRPSPGA